MIAKSESTKLSPAERLARKRVAARLRQQRCRARKRQAMLEKKRLESEKLRAGVVTHDTAATAAAIRTTMPLRSPPPRHHMHRPLPIQTFCPPQSHQQIQASQQPIVTPPSEHLYNCVSFESQRSFEEAHKTLKLQPSLSLVSESSCSAATVVSPTASPPRKHRNIVRVLSEEKTDEPLVAEEEAAIAAMLSLKSASDKPREGERDQPPSSPPMESAKATQVRAAASCVPTTPPETVSTIAASKAHMIGAPSHFTMSPKRYAHTTPMHHMPQQQPRRMEYHHDVYGPPRPLSRRVSYPVAYYRSVPAPVPPPRLHYSRGYYAATPMPQAPHGSPRRYTIRYDYE